MFQHWFSTEPRPDGLIGTLRVKVTESGNDGFPGKVLETFSLTDLPWSSTISVDGYGEPIPADPARDRLRISSQTHPLLLPCKSYFITFFWDPGSSGSGEHVCVYSTPRNRFRALAQQSIYSTLPWRWDFVFEDSTPEMRVTGHAGPPGDIIAEPLAWDSDKGGVKFRYRVNGGAASIPTTAKLFWANGTTRDNIFWDKPIFTKVIPYCFDGLSPVINVPGSLLKNAPENATHLVLLVDPDNLVHEVNDQDSNDNNIKALGNPKIRFDAPQDRERLTSYTIKVLTEILMVAGQHSTLVTSVARTPRRQAELMFDQMLDKTISNYDPPGERVKQIYRNETVGLTKKQIKEKREEIILKMLKKIELEGPDKVSNHCSDFSVLNVVDLSRSEIANLFGLTARKRFVEAACADGRVKEFLAPKQYLCTKTYDPTYHLVFPQTEVPTPFANHASPAPEPATRQSIVAVALKKGETSNSLNMNCDIDLKYEAGRIWGVVSNDHKDFHFAAYANDSFSISVNATMVSAGFSATNDDSMVFLFDESGRLLASNDDEVGGGLNAGIHEFVIPETGRYIIAVTTYPNTPTLDTNGVLKGWDDNGGSSIAFSGEIVLLSSVPRLFVRPLDSGEVLVEWEGDAVLQESVAITGPWAYALGASSPLIIEPTQPKRYFRLATGGEASSADLRLRILNSPGHLQMNTNGTYTFGVSNAGPSMATGVVLIVEVPSGVDFISIQQSQGLSTISANTMTCSFGELGVASNATVTVVVQPHNPGIITNSVTVFAGQTDLNTNDNTAIITSIVDTVVSVTGNGNTREGTAGSTNFASFEVRLAQPSALPVTVNYFTQDGTATAGSDYISKSGSLSFAPGVTVTNIPVAAIGDDLPEADEYFFLGISAPINASIGQGSTSAIIENDDVSRISFSNASPIQIVGGGAILGAMPYPSALVLSNGVFPGLNSKITVTLRDLSYNFPSDLAIVLVDPTDTGVVLMSGAGGSLPANGVTLTFDDNAEFPIFEFGFQPLSSGTYLPSFFNPAVSLPPPAPAGPYHASLDLLTDLSGSWRLFVFSSRPGFGVINGGWTLTFLSE